MLLRSCVNGFVCSVPEKNADDFHSAYYGYGLMI